MSTNTQKPHERQQQQLSIGGRLAQTRAPAATIAGLLEIGFFHPFDTVAKRLMANKTSLLQTPGTGGSRLCATASHLNQIIFKHHAQDGMLRKLFYLYPGSLYAVVYKVFQRIYKFAGQPLVRDYINRNHRDSRLFALFGKRNETLMREGTAGCLIGMGEVFLLPLDRLKVLSQVNEEAMKKGLLPLLRQEGVRGMYAGIGITICRNAPGSFALFAGASFAKHTIFGIQEEGGPHSKAVPAAGSTAKPERTRATLAQNMAASSVGACLSITVSNPMDVIKTRMQHATSDVRRSTGSTIASMVREEGIVLPFFKGLTPKIIASAPKLFWRATPRNRRIPEPPPHHVVMEEMEDDRGRGGWGGSYPTGLPEKQTNNKTTTMKRNQRRLEEEAHTADTCRSYHFPFFFGIRWSEDYTLLHHRTTLFLSNYLFQIYLFFVSPDPQGYRKDDNLALCPPPPLSIHLPSTSGRSMVIDMYAHHANELLPYGDC
eukprot:gene1386-809_t